jgi:hypothetical protein
LIYGGKAFTAGEEFSPASTSQDSLYSVLYTPSESFGRLVWLPRHGFFSIILLIQGQVVALPFGEANSLLATPQFTGWGVRLFAEISPLALEINTGLHDSLGSQSAI